MSLEEYICETEDVKMWQKWLNQWRHEYKIEILGMTQCTHEEKVTILLKRTKRGEERR